MNDRRLDHLSVPSSPNDGALTCDRQTDREWLSELFEHSHQKLLNYAAALLSGDRDAAIDAVQETFLRLCRQQRSDVEGHVQPWMYRTCRNYIFDQLRQRNRMSQSDPNIAIADSRIDGDPSHQLTQSDELVRCSQQIAKLPEQQQEVLNLRIMQGLSYKEIASVTGMTVNNVGVTLHQAILKLRTSLAT